MAKLVIVGIPDQIREQELKERLPAEVHIDINAPKGHAIVTFDDQREYLQLLEVGSLDVCNACLEVYPVNGQICVRGLPPDSSKDTVELFFENEKKSSGGDIDDVSFNPDERSATVTFCKKEVAWRVVERKPLLLGDCQLEVSLCNPFKRDKRVVVNGINPSTSNDTVELFFESNKKSGGGEIERLEHLQNQGKAIITYVDLSVAANVVKIGQHRLENSNLSVTWHAAPAGKAILVKGILPSTTKQTLEMFFESKKRSSGGPIESIEHKQQEGWAKIVYKLPSDAEAVLAKKEFTLDKAILSVTRASYEENIVDPPGASAMEEATQNHTILVEGLGASLSTDVVKSFFENKRSGGGKIRQIKRKSESTAFITYFNPDDAKNVLRKETFTIVKTTVKVSDGQLSQETDCTDEAMGVTTGDLESASLEVTAEPRVKLDPQFLQLLLEKQANGGEIISCEPYEEGPVIVTFKRMQDAKNLIASKESLTLSGSKLRIRAVASREVSNTNAIKVQNLPVGTKEKDIIGMLSGKSVDAIHVGKSEATLTFCKSDDVANILEAHTRRGTVLKGQKLQLDRLTPPRPPPIITGPIERNTLFVSNISSAASTEELIEFLQRVPCCGISKEDVCYGPKEGTAIIKFNQMPDFQTLRKFTGERPLCDKMLYIQPVEKPDSIQVDGILRCGKEFLELYFQSERQSGGTNIKNMTVLPKDNDCAIIQFNDRSAVTRVLQKSHIVTEKAIMVNVRIVYGELGFVPFKRQPSQQRESAHKDAGHANNVGEQKKWDLETLEIKTLKPWQIAVLKVSKFDTEMKALSPPVEVTIGDHLVTLKADAGSVSNARIRMLEIINEFNFETRPYPSGFCEFLRRDDIQSYITSRLLAIAKIEWVLEKDKMTICAKGSELVRKAFEVLEDTFKIETFQLDKAQIMVVKSPEWGKVLENLRSHYAFSIEVCDGESDDKSIELICLSSDSSPIRKVLEGFIQDHTLTEETLDIDAGVAKLIQKHLQSKLRDIETDQGKTFINLHHAHTKPFIQIQGPKSTIVQARKAVETLVGSVQTEDHMVTEPAMERFFCGDRGSEFISAVEGRIDAIISVLGGEKQMSKTNGMPITPEGTLYEVTLPGGISVAVSVGDITAIEVDAIICSSNPDLHLKYGLAKCIALKAEGRSLQEECLRRVETRGPLKPGEVFAASVRGMKCQTVLFMVAPRWKGGHGDEERDLLKGLVKCLTVASKKKLRSIAIPAIGAGNKIPENMITGTIIKAIQEQGRSSSIKNVILVDGKQHIAEQFVDILRKATSSDTKKPKRSCVTGFLRSGDNQIKTREGVTVSLKKGDIAKQKVDVIVNVTSKDLNLRKGGAISKSILEAAGPQIQQECSAIGGVQPGKKVVTAGYTLNCTKVYHGSCPNWNKDKDFCETMINNFVHACLKSADKNKSTTIAIPAIGTGGHHVPSDRCAKIILEEIATFSATRPQHLKEITLVVYDKDFTTVNAFEALFKAVGPPEKSGGASKRQRNLAVPSMAATSTRIKGSGPEAENKTLTLRVTAPSKESLQATMRSITDVYSRELKTEILCSQEEKNTISKLTDQHISKIYALEGRYSVKIKVERRQRHESVEIKGTTSNVALVAQQIRTMFAEARREETERKLTELRTKQAQWYYCEDGEWLPYDKEINGVIESAYENKQKCAEWTEESDDKYGIDFSKNVEIGLSGAGVSVGVPVKRVVAGTSELPKHWEQQSNSDVLKLVLLSTTSTEYKEVDAAIRQTGGGSVNTIKSISRVQNPSLYRKYQVHKDLLDHQNPANTVNERTLWHGTAADTTHSICHNGFDRGYCGKHGTAFGKGVYFARDLSYSARYGTPNSSGDRFVLWCSVLTGMVTQGNPSMAVAPVRSGNIHFDSVVDGPSNPSVFVIFSDTQAYPKYLINFT